MLNNWILARETALKKIREIKLVKKIDLDLFQNCLNKSLKIVTSWNTESEFQQKKIKKLTSDLYKFIDFLEKDFNFKK